MPRRADDEGRFAALGNGDDHVVCGHAALSELTSAEVREILADRSQDADLREMAESELESLQADHDRRLDGLKEAIVTDDDAVIDSIIMEIRAGTGGDEAALFARDLYEMYVRFSDRKGFKIEVLDQSGNNLGGFKELTMSIKGAQVYRWLGYEGGGHRVQRVPETEAQGRVHTSAATVAVLPEPEDLNIDINWDTDVDEFISRSGGPGGQNVNKVSSAIRLMHKETGITVSMRDEKSQHKNRAKARRIMLTRVYDHHRQASDAKRDSARRTMIGSGDRSQRIRTYNFPQNRISDHRINVDIYSLEKFMQGEMDEMIRALQTHDKEQRLKNM
ncbi:MAG: PCRF domain-containing protein [Planctomycetes bacterium]|nr:PCRF domain-containing protein [Planctomycetota bacterium]